MKQTNPRQTKTLVIGAGVSGLGCAHVLHQANKDFLVIGKSLGGRIHAESAGSEVPFGTAYMCEDYFHMRKFTTRTASGKQDASRYFFYNGSDYVNAYHFKNIGLIWSFLRFKKILKKFRTHIVAYREKTDTASLKEIFEQDEFLRWTWETPASEFIRYNKFEKLNEFMIDPIVSTTTYAHWDEINVAYYLGMSLPLVVPTWGANFQDTVKKMTHGIEQHILIGTVTDIQRNIENSNFLIHTSAGNVMTNSIVFAAPYNAIGHLYPNIPKPHKSVDIHVLQVTGTRKEPFANKPVVFLRAKEHNGIYTLFGMKSGVDLVYSKYSNPDLSLYYSQYVIEKDVYWDPVMHVPGNTLIDNKVDDNVYLAGDYNISGLEDAYVSGRSVGHRILRELY